METFACFLELIYKYRSFGVCYLAAVNFAAFLLFWIDKRRAKLGRWRIPEARLLLLVIIGGAFGGFLGMQLLRHKTKHTKFVLIIPLALALQLSLITLSVLGSAFGF